MKFPVYCRVARDNRSRNGRRFDAGLAYNPEPLRNPDGAALITVHFAVTVEVPDQMFRPAPLPDAGNILVDPEMAATQGTPAFVQRQLPGPPEEVVDGTVVS